MKKAALLFLSLTTLPVYAQGLLGSLNKYQDTLKEKPAVDDKKPTPEVQASKISSTSASAKCEENDQTSLPLSYVSSLITKADGKLDFQHDARGGSLTVSAPEMIGNCSSMLQWSLKQPEIQGQKAYAVEAKIKEGENCTPEGCTYKVAKVKDGVFDKFEDVVLKPTLKGFEECLQKSGVIADNKVVPGAIYTSQLNEKFTGLDQSGKLLFVSHGPASAMVKAKYGKYEPIDRCDYYEKAHPEVTQLITYAEQERARLDAEAAKLVDCPINEYHKVADFIDKYEAYASQLSQVRDRLILETAKKSAAAIGTGKYKDEDLKVLADFEKYIIQPKVELAIGLYEAMQDLEGEEQKAVEARLKTVLADLAALNKSPYFTSAHTKKLVDDGRFEDAKHLNTLLLTLDAYPRMGQKIKGVVMTPSAIHQNVLKSARAFSEQMTQEKEYYEIRTGQTDEKKSEAYLAGVQQRSEMIQMRTQSYNEEIMSEYQRVQQPYGHCFKYWVNTQKCVEDSVLRIQQLQAELQAGNKHDQEIAKELAAKAEVYKKLEAQGERYIATQNGEEVPESQEKKDNLRPSQRKPDERIAQQQPQQQGQGQMSQQQLMLQAQMQGQMGMQNGVNPYAQQNMFQGGGYNLGNYAQYAGNNYNPYGNQNMFGQQAYNTMGYGMNNNMYGNQMYGNQMYGNNNSFGFQGSFNLGLGGGMNMGGYPYQQQQQMGYNPYMMYNQYSMYGR